MNIAIIGAGMTGLTAGHRLSQRGHKVTVYEKENSLGGLASAVNIGSEAIDRFYHHIFVSDAEILALIDELNLNNRLTWYEPKNAIYTDNVLHPFTTPLDLLLFKPLSLISRIRMGIMVLSSGFIKDYSPFESITAKEWIIRRSGQEVWQKVWEPLIKSKFDIDSNSISGTWIWNKLKLRGASRGKSLRKEMLGYIDGAFKIIADELARQIIQNGGNILLEKMVTAIVINENGKVDVMAQDYNDLTRYRDLRFRTGPESLKLEAGEYPPPEIVTSPRRLKGGGNLYSRYNDLTRYRDLRFRTGPESLKLEAGEYPPHEIVTSTRRLKDGGNLYSHNKVSYDKVLFTGAPSLLSKILKSPFNHNDITRYRNKRFPTGTDYSRFKESLDRISFKANICLVLELSQSLSPYYWITVAQEGLPFVLIVEHTNLVGVKGYGSHIIYLSRYLDASDPLYRASDQDIIKEFINGLKKVFPDIKNENIKNTILSRATFAQPVIPLGYGKNIPEIKTPAKGLYFASMPQIYPEDRGLNYAVRLGQEAANEILGNL